MNNFCSALWKTAGVLVLVFHATAWAAESPLEVIRGTIQRATAVLQNPTYQGKEKFQARIAKVREIVEPQFDVQEIAKRTLGTYWQERTEEERQQFIHLFTELVQKTYGGTLDRYNANVQFFYDQERIDGQFAEVDTRIFDPAQNKAFAVTYKLHQVNGKWLVYDVIAENVSMVRNYRNQFNRILSKSSYQDLVQTLQTKIKELDIAPPSTTTRNTSAG
ncbi:MAG TPA: ABC transporter substrate-binding protein [Methylomirabilota bacterium]|nr:ABC transporter substrate-binding protein [Methylomirabilota bacterium]